MAIPEFVQKLRRKVGNDLLLLPGAGAVVVNPAGHVLLQRDRETVGWRIPGGVVDPGEEPADTIVREMHEEAGVEVTPVRLVGLYAEPPKRYGNGDLTSYVTAIFLCQADGREPCVRDDESLEFRYFPPDKLPEELSELNRGWVRRALAEDVAAEFRIGGR